MSNRQRVPQARQGEVWFADLEPIQGREQAGRRPVLAISVDQLGTGPSELVIVAPLTTSRRPSPLYAAIDPPDGGVREPSHAMPEMVRSIWRGRLVERWGVVTSDTLELVLRRVHLLTRPPV
ncbi:MAG: type II toxin-antitoxin system PemK/MazF family toxin [Gammaproteobacteria bacterium]